MMNKALKLLTQAKHFRWIPKPPAENQKIQPMFSNLKPQDIPFKRRIVIGDQPPKAPAADTFLSNLQKSTKEYMHATSDMLALIGCVLAVGYTAFFVMSGIKEVTHGTHGTHGTQGTQGMQSNNVLLPKRP